MARARVAAYVCSLVLIAVLQGDVLAFPSISFQDPVGSVPVGPQQAYGEHTDCTNIGLTVQNYRQGGLYQVEPEVDTGDDDWAATESTDLEIYSYYMVARNNGTGSPYASVGGSVSQ